jgi:ribosomal-protein-alanine acetyltransferase
LEATVIVSISAGFFTGHAGVGAVMNASVMIRRGSLNDLRALVELEKLSFSTDRLSRRSFRHWLTTEHCVLLVAELDGRLAGYILVLFYSGTRLSRLYSIAVHPDFKGMGVARELIGQAEKNARDNGKFYMRLEVNVANQPAIRLYESLGFQRFGLYKAYYEDHTDAFRFQKRIRYYQDSFQHRSVKWYRQTTDFTCGPASLMMAMQVLDQNYLLSPEEELDIWREATTIFMTSGHGGCHPVGLALAARQRAFQAEVWISQTETLFIDGVRNLDNKLIVERVDKHFKQQAEQQQIPVHYANITQNELIDAFKAGKVPLVMISTYRMDRKKTPHWVVISGYDDDCLYVHDPDPTDGLQNDLDCQYIPIANEDFDRMSVFGKSRLRTAVILSNGTV